MTTNLENIIRYDRNLLLWGRENQQKLQEGRITIYGTSSLAQKVALSLISLGIGDITLMGTDLVTRDDPKDFLLRFQGGATFLKKAEAVGDALIPFTDSDTQNIDALPVPVDPGMLTYAAPDIIIDATNDPTSKQKLARISVDRGLLFLSAGTTKTDLYVRRLGPSGRWQAYALLDYEEPRFRLQDQGTFSSSIAAGLLSNMVRRHYFSLPSEQGTYLPKERHEYQGLFLEGILPEFPSRNRNLPFLEGAKGLIIGVGGIGNFLSLDLALLGFAQIDLLDHDTIEETNLNRQPLLAGGVGRHKAEVVAERLRMVNPKANIRDFPERFRYRNGEISPTTINGTRYDFIFSCVDNEQARIEISQYAMDTGTVLVSGRLGDDWGQVATYLPRRNHCVDCQENIRASLENSWVGESPAMVDQEQTGCQASPNPNIVIPNIIVAGTMIGTGLRSLYHPSLFTPKTPPLRYTSLGNPAFGEGTRTTPYFSDHGCVVA